MEPVIFMNYFAHSSTHSLNYHIGVRVSDHKLLKEMGEFEHGQQ